MTFDGRSERRCASCGAAHAPGVDHTCSEVESVSAGPPLLRCSRCGETYEWRGGAAAHECPSPPDDPVNHPRHYRHPCGAECADIAEGMTFCAGSALKYLWRAGQKLEPGKSVEESRLQDLRKARWFLDREIARLSREASLASCALGEGVPL